MATAKELENQVEMEVINSTDVETPKCDTNDSPQKTSPPLENEESPQASFTHIMERRITQFYQSLKVLTLFLAPILILLFVLYNIYANPKKEVPPEVITTLTKVMTNQMGGNLFPILEDPTNSSSITTSS